MKRLLMTMALTSATVAQTAPEPEFADIFFRLDSGKVVPVELKATRFFEANIQSVPMVTGPRADPLHGLPQLIAYTAGAGCQPHANPTARIAAV